MACASKAFQHSRTHGICCRASAGTVHCPMTSRFHSASRSRTPRHLQGVYYKMGRLEHLAKNMWSAPSTKLAGHVVDADVMVLNRQSKFITIDEQPNDDIVHLNGSRKADCFRCPRI